MSYTIPKLIVAKQTSLTYGNHVKNGVSQVVHTVVKQSNFNITLAFDHNELCDSRTLLKVNTISPDRPIINFYQFQIEARLYYDSEDQKEVDFVKHKPIEYKPQVNENGTQCNIECRLNVLTSQLEDMNFRIKFRALELTSQNEISPILRAISAPIKVISKPEPTKVKKSAPKKRSTSDIILDSLINIHETQKFLTSSMSSMLDPLALPISSPSPNNMGILNSSGNSMTILNNSSNNNNNNNNNLMNSGNMNMMGLNTSNNNNNFVPPPCSKKQKHFDNTPQDFESSFRNLMDSFLLLSLSERPLRVKDIINRIGVSGDYISELHDLFSSEGLDKSIGKITQNTSSEMPIANPSETAFECHCENCPHRAELEKIEDFYRSAFYN